MIKKKPNVTRIKALFTILAFVLFCTSCVSNTNDSDNQEISDVSATPEYVHPQQELVVATNEYYDSLRLDNHEILFYSEAPVPSDYDAKMIREKLCSGISTFAAGKIRTTLEDAVSSMRAYYDAAYANNDQFWSDLETNQLVVMSSTNKPISIAEIVSELQGIKEYIDDPALVNDLEAAQKLMLYSDRNKTVEGLFFAHHILSDLAYWGFLYDMDMREYSTWEIAVEIEEQSVFYGLTNTCGYNYPSRITNMIDDPSVDVIESMKNSEFKALVEKKDKEIADLISGFEPDDLNLMKESLTRMNETLAAIVYGSTNWDNSFDPDTPEMGSSHARLLEDISTCLSTTPGGALEEDLVYVQRKLNEVYEISSTNSSSPDADQKYCFFWSKRTVNELLKIVFDNENPMGYNEFYYGMTKTLEGEGAISQKYYA